MTIIIPFNASYLRERYIIEGDFLELLKTEVLPGIVERLSLADRVETIEIITDVDIKNVIEKQSKVLFNYIDIGTDQNANDVAQKILKYRLSEGDIIVQLNPLYPFVSVDSIFMGYKKVLGGITLSAMGSFTNSASEENIEFIKRGDLGVFSIYRESRFNICGQRSSPPVEMIGLKASELISLRTADDLDLYELIVNSGYEI